MPVRKFRSVADMPQASPRTPLDPENLREVCGLMELTHRLSGQKLPAGLWKFRSVEEASAFREMRERQASLDRSSS